MWIHFNGCQLTTSPVEQLTTSPVEQQLTTSPVEQQLTTSPVEQQLTTSPVEQDLVRSYRNKEMGRWWIIEVEIIGLQLTINDHSEQDLVQQEML
jgi:hypothetical protein